MGEFPAGRQPLIPVDVLRAVGVVIRAAGPLFQKAVAVVPIHAAGEAWARA
jgi:hypothetical protein